jgi:DNA-3-methyladenine glycosylase II
MRRAVLHLKKSDPVLRGVIERVGPYRIEYRPPVFATLARAILFQQLAGAVAARIYERFEGLLDGAGVEPQAVARLPLRKLRWAGLSKQKSEYIRDLARKTVAGAVRFEGLEALPDEEVVETLTQVKGVGVWTAQMFLIFALRRPDVLPTGDYGIRAAMRNTYGLPELPKPPEMERIAAPWRPWSSVACWYLWRTLEK